MENKKDFNQLAEDSRISDNSFVDLVPQQTDMNFRDEEEDFDHKSDQQDQNKHKHNKSSFYRPEGKLQINRNHKQNKLSSDMAFLDIPMTQVNQETVSQNNSLNRFKQSLFQRGFSGFSSKIRSKFWQGHQNQSPTSHDQDQQLMFSGRESSNFSSSVKQSIDFSEQLNDSNQESDDSEAERIKEKMPEGVKQLLLQPKRDIDLEEMDEDSILADNERLKQLMLKSHINLEKSIEEQEPEIDNNYLQKALIIEDTDFNQFLQKTVDLKLKQKQDMPRCIISYKAKSRMYWDLIIILFAIQNCIMIPIQVAFGEDFFDETAKAVLEYFGYVVDGLFFVDIMINFRTSFLNVFNGKEITNGKVIALRYIKSGNFFLDVASTVPFDDIIALFISSENAKHLGLLGIIKMIRMLRLRKIITFMNVQQSLKVSFRIIQLIMLLLLIVHWVSCIWYFFVTYDYDNEDKLWTPPFDNDGPEDFYNGSSQYQYLVVFYYAVLLLIGRANEMAPINYPQTIFTAVTLIFGSFVLTFLFGNIAATLANATIKESKLSERLNFIQTTMALIRLPEQLQDEVLAYVMQAEQAPEVQYDLNKFLETLSPSLKASVQNYLHHQVISNLDEFREANEAEINFMSGNLKNLLIMPNDIIIQQGNEGDAMYFIINGRLEVYLNKKSQISQPLSFNNSLNKDDTGKLRNPMQFTFNPEKYHEIQSSSQQSKALNSLNNSLNQEQRNEMIKEQQREYQKNTIMLNVLEKGEYFGEISVLSKMKRTASVRSIEYCTLSYLTKDNIKILRKEYPQIYQNFMKRLGLYNDEEMLLRKQMLRNIPFLKNISNQLLCSMLNLLKEVNYDKGSSIIKHGDLSDRLFIVWKGTLKVEIFYKGYNHVFDRLNRGSSFCVYSAFADDYTQMFDFKISSLQATILSLKSSALIKLSKTNLELAELLKSLEISIEEHRKSDFDFFRFTNPSLETKNQSYYKSQLKNKFRSEIMRIFKGIKNGSLKFPETLIIVQQLCQQRKIREEKIKNTSANQEEKTSQVSKSNQEKEPFNQYFSYQMSETFRSKDNIAQSVDFMSSSISSQIFSPNFRMKNQQITDQQEEKMLRKIKNHDHKIRKYKLQSILDPQEVPGIDDNILDRIQGLPKDQNIYTVQMIEKYENLKTRIQKVKDSRENVQFMSKVIYNQNLQIQELKAIFHKQSKYFEDEIARLAQKLRKNKTVSKEAEEVQKQEKSLNNENIEFTRSQTKVIDPIEEFLNTGIFHESQKSQGSNESQAKLNLTKITKQNLRTLYQDEGDDYLKSPLDYLEVDFNTSNTKQAVKRKGKEESEISFQKRINKINEYITQKFPRIKRKIRSKSQNDQKRPHIPQERTAQYLQEQLNIFSPKNESKYYNNNSNQKKVRHISEIVEYEESNEQVQQEKPKLHLESSQQDNFSQNLSNLVKQALKRSKGVKNKRQHSKQASAMKNNQMIDDQQDDLIEDDQSSIRNSQLRRNHSEHKKNQINSQCSITQVQLSNQNQEQGKNNQVSSITYQEITVEDYNSVQFYNIPVRPQTRDQSRLEFKRNKNDKSSDQMRMHENFSKIDSESQFQSLQPSTLQSKVRLISAKPRLQGLTRNQKPNQITTSDLGFYKQESNDQLLSQSGLNTYSSAYTLKRFNNKGQNHKSTLRETDEIVKDDSPFMNQTTQKTLQTDQTTANLQSKSTLIKQAIKNTEVKKVQARSQSPISYSSKSKKKLKISEEDKGRWEFYRKMISKNH